MKLAKHTIIQKLKGFRPFQWALLGAFVLVLSFTGYHAYRTIEDTIYWREHRDQPIKQWMNVGYVAHSFHIPPPVLYEALELPPKVKDRRPLKEIAKSQNRSFEEIKTKLEEAVKEFRLAHPPPPPNTGGKP